MNRALKILTRRIREGKKNSDAHLASFFAVNNAQRDNIR